MSASGVLCVAVAVMASQNVFAGDPTSRMPSWPTLVLSSDSSHLANAQLSVLRLVWRSIPLIGTLLFSASESTHRTPFSLRTRPSACEVKFAVFRIAARHFAAPCAFAAAASCLRSAHFAQGSTTELLL